ncbi:RidA family protein [Pseudolabrys sp. Root1462]|uniref:RidA family protein n=1 Tax=Pseudolabrys sp. Root1462 TaxID=1736466 RepID=UPI0012E3BA2A|nr:RidA family protein [Pseudolabrys sp. Root1462]
MIEILQPDGWLPAKGYANGMAAEGRQVFIAGQVGWNERCEFVSDDFVDQVEQTLKNIVAVLRQAGGEPHHIVRLTWYLTDKREYLARPKELGEAYRRVIGRHFPTMSAIVVVALIEDRAKVEIEATAVIPRG